MRHRLLGRNRLAESQHLAQRRCHRPGLDPLRVMPCRQQPGPLALVAEAVAHHCGRQCGEIPKAADAEALEHEQQIVVDARGARARRAE